MAEKDSSGEQTAAVELRKIQNELQSGRYQPIECVRLGRDLERVRRRLEKGEYYYTDFTGNTFNVPERTREYFIYFNSYFSAARTWAKVLAEIPVSGIPSVVDLCPGWAPKVELALFYLRYQGRVVLVDKDQDSVQQNKSFIGLFNPEYQIEAAIADVFDLHTPPGDLILANHLIDDLLLGRFAREGGYDPGRICECEDSMRDAWRALLGKRKYFLSKAVEELSALFARLVAHGGYLVLTQYQAYVEKLLDLDEAAAFCKEAAAGIIKSLEALGFDNNRDLVVRCLTGFGGWFKEDECFLLKRPA